MPILELMNYVNKIQNVLRLSSVTLNVFWALDEILCSNN